MHLTQELFLRWSYWADISLSGLSFRKFCWFLLFSPLFLQIYIIIVLRFLQGFGQVAAKQFFNFCQTSPCHLSLAGELNIELEVFISLFVACSLLQRLHSEQLLLVKIFLVCILYFFDGRQYFLRFGVDELRVNYFDFTLENEQYCVLLFLVGINDRFTFLASRNDEAIEQFAGIAFWKFLKESLLLEDILQLVPNQHDLEALSEGFLDISNANRNDVWVFLSYQCVSPNCFIIQRNLMFEDLSFFNEPTCNSVFDPSNSSRLEDVEWRGELSLLADLWIFLIVLAHGDIGNGLSLPIG